MILCKFKNTCNFFKFLYLKCFVSFYFCFDQLWPSHTHCCWWSVWFLPQTQFSILRWKTHSHSVTDHTLNVSADQLHITQLEKAQMNILSSFTQTYIFSVSLYVEGRLSFKYFTNTWLCPSKTDKTYWTRPSLWSQNQRPVSGSFQFSHSSRCRCKNCNTSLQSVWDWYNNLNILSCFLSLVFELKIRSEFWMHSSPVTTQLNVSDEL